jgi:hypothetical protein
MDTSANGVEQSSEIKLTDLPEKVPRTQSEEKLIFSVSSAGEIEYPHTEE